MPGLQAHMLLQLCRQERIQATSKYHFLLPRQQPSSKRQELPLLSRCKMDLAHASQSRHFTSINSGWRYCFSCGTTQPCNPGGRRKWPSGFPVAFHISASPSVYIMRPERACQLPILCRLLGTCMLHFKARSCQRCPHRMGSLRLAGERAEVQVEGVRGPCGFKAAYGTRAGGTLLLVVGPPVHHAHAGGVPQQPKAHALQARH